MALSFAQVTEHEAVGMGGDFFISTNPLGRKAEKVGNWIQTGEGIFQMSFSGRKI